MTVIAGLINDDPPQHPMPLVPKVKTAEIGEHVEVAVGVADTHGGAEKDSVVNGHAIASVIGWPHIIESPRQTLSTESHARLTVNVGQLGHVVVTSA